MNKNIIKVNGVEINLDAVASKESSSTLATTESELEEEDDLDKIIKQREIVNKIKITIASGLIILSGIAAVDSIIKTR